MARKKKVRVKTKAPPYDGAGNYSNYLHISMAYRRFTPAQIRKLCDEIADAYDRIEHGGLNFHPWIQIPP